MTNHVVEFKRNLDVLLSDDRHKKKEHYKRNVVSCGIIMYKLINHEYYYLCVHPGGPYFKYKDKYAWSIPKGVVETNERFKETACREFEEETGIKITNELKSKLIYIGYIRQKSIEKWIQEEDSEYSDYTPICADEILGVAALTQLEEQSRKITRQFVERDGPEGERTVNGMLMFNQLVALSLGPVKRIVCGGKCLPKNITHELISRRFVEYMVSYSKSNLDYNRTYLFHVLRKRFKFFFFCVF